MKRNEILNEISLGNYQAKATKDKAMSKMDKVFGYPGDHDRKIANREKGLERAKRRSISKPAEPTKVDREALTAKLDQLTSQFDPHYDRSDDYSYWRKQKSISDQISGIKRQLGSLDEMTPVPGTPEQGKLKSVDTVKKTATVTTPTGDKEVPMQNLTQDPTKPGSLTAQVDAADSNQMKPGAPVKVTTVTESISSLKKLAGL